MGLGNWMTTIASAVVVLAVILNLPTTLWLPIEKATEKYLAESTLKTTLKDVRHFQEAQKLSSLKSELSAHDVNLYAVVHEVHGVEGFRPFFQGDIFLDSKRRFYGPRERWLHPLLGLSRVSVWMNIKRANDKNIPGDLKGEGRLLGGVYVIGAGDQGIILEHREEEWGDHVNTKEILEAIKKV